MSCFFPSRLVTHNRYRCIQHKLLSRWRLHKYSSCLEQSSRTSQLKTDKRGYRRDDQDTEASQRREWLKSYIVHLVPCEHGTSEWTNNLRNVRSNAPDFRVLLCVTMTATFFFFFFQNRFYRISSLRTTLAGCTWNTCIYINCMWYQGYSVPVGLVWQ